MDTRGFYGTRRSKIHRAVTVQDAMSTVERLTRPTTIIVLPPFAGDSAADSDVEDVPDNLNNDDPFETAGELEVIAEEPDEDESVSSEDESSPPAKMCKNLKQKQAIQWKKSTKFTKVISSLVPSHLPDSFPVLLSLSPFSIWSLKFDDKMLMETVMQSNLYANRDKNDSQFQVTVDEICHFLGILLLSGYHALPQESDYWSSQQDLGVPIVREAMSSKRYQTIKKYFHLADNAELKAGDKTAKVAPLITAVNVNLVQFGFFHHELSIDESMTPYFGRHSMKMFTRGKPIRFGFKRWCMCGIDGCPYNIKLYTGRESSMHSMEPLGSRVINHMVDVIEKHSDVIRHHLFFDNFFTSYALIKSLAERNVAATGTIRELRTGGAHKELRSAKDMKNSGQRGDYDYRCDGSVYVAKWHNNSVVCIASNNLTHNPLQTARRRVKGTSDVAVSQPFVVKRYNEGMGGVDLMDRLLASYRPSVRGKKWWWPLFTNVLNVSVVAAWKIHCHLHGSDMDHLTFRRDITLCLLKGTAIQEHSIRSNHVANLPKDVRQTQELLHEHISCTQGRCRMCSKNTMVMCRVCKVRLHSDKGKTCFVDYHK